MVSVNCRICYPESIGQYLLASDNHCLLLHLLSHNESMYIYDLLTKQNGTKFETQGDFPSLNMNFTSAPFVRLIFSGLNSKHSSKEAKKG